VVSIEFDQLNNPKYLDLVNKIGFDEYGRKLWSKMKPKDKIDAVSEILRDSSELDERLASTNFNYFLAALSDFVGGDARQEDILAKQLDVELKGLCGASLGESAISESIFEAFKITSRSCEFTLITSRKTAWNIYLDCDNNAFENRLETQVDPRSIERPFLELEKYHKLAAVLEWEMNP